MSFVPIIVRDNEGPFRTLEQQMRMAEELFPYLNCSDRNHSRSCNRQNVEIHPYLNKKCDLNKLCNQEDCVTEDKENYLMKLNLHHYAPEEIAVKVVDEKSIVVEAKHESKNENGSTFRQLTRQFVVPESHDLKKVETKLSGKGLKPGRQNARTKFLLIKLSPSYVSICF
ncbi:hypothetical protein FQR65_LT12964 [Abscondita terminalis]|nr:hypothetical protein FQR65_LT12964 [Abscondita terminalis]